MRGGGGKVVRHVQRSGGLWHIVRCASCGFTFVANPRTDTADHLDEIPESDPGDRRRYHHILALLRRRLAAESKVIEVGSGFGSLGVLLSPHFNYLGVEPAHGIASYAAARGISVREQLFSAAPEFKDARAVIFDNVLEHVADPLGLLRTAHACLVPGGLVVVIVPNRWDMRQLIPRWRDANHWIPPDHINYFTKRHLTRALRASGFSSVRPFGTQVLRREDGRYWLRGAMEDLRILPFGLNVWGKKS